MTFRRFRILILLGVLAAAIGLTWLEQNMVRAWWAPLEVAVVPINGDGSPEATETIRTLQTGDFEDINAFLERESARYGVKQSPAMQVTLLPELKQKPPAPPRDGSVLKTVFWSLQLRWWVYRQSDAWLPQLGTVKLFVLYHAPQDGVALEHSLGLQKGLIGVVHAFADPRQTRQNNIVIAHELLHTLGATDKYDQEGRPMYPDGVADPAQPPGAPQHEAEIMAGRYVNAGGRVVMPPGLEQCVIGARTAHEINFDEGFRRRFASGH
ncbi:zinc metalloprotease [Thiobacillus sp.]